MSSNTNILQILDDMGYKTISQNPESILSSLLRNSLEKRFGKRTIKSIFEDAEYFFGKKEEEVLTNYDLFSEVLQRIFGEPATQAIFKVINNDLLEYVISIEGDLSNKKILNEIGKNQVINFVQNLKGHEHVILLLKDKNFRNVIALKFFQSTLDDQAPKIIISTKPRTIPKVNNFLSESFLPKLKTNFVKFWLDWLNKINSSNNSNLAGKIFVEECNYWMEKGFVNENLLFEKEIGIQLQYNLSLICGYDTTQITDQKYLGQITQCHEYVILDTPYEVYKKGN